MRSPYFGLPIELWEAKTRQLIEQHPLAPNEINDLIVKVWHEIFQSNIAVSKKREVQNSFVLGSRE